MNIIERMQKNLEEYKRKVKENPRYPIEHLADEKGYVSVFFTPEGFINFKEGKEVKGSTERFLPDDIIHSVHKDRIEKITDGGTIIHINKLN
jgi:hypothetical protein